MGQPFIGLSRYVLGLMDCLIVGLFLGLPLWILMSMATLVGFYETIESAPSDVYSFTNVYLGGCAGLIYFFLVPTI